MTRRPTTPGGVELLWLTARECSEGETELLKALSQANARVQELEKFVTATDLGDIRSRCHKAEALVAEFEAEKRQDMIDGLTGKMGLAVLLRKAEARMKALEKEERIVVRDRDDCLERAQEAEARVAVLREALTNINKHTVDFVSRNLSQAALAALDPAATALSDFAQEVDEWIGPVLDGLPAAVADKLIAWRRARP